MQRSGGPDLPRPRPLFRALHGCDAHIRAIVAEAPQLEGWNAYHAAMILQHGTCPSDFEAATKLFETAAATDIADAAALSRAAHDRWQPSLGQPQRYGTQLALNGRAGGVLIGRSV